MEKESATSMRSNPGGGGGDSGSKGEFVPRAGSKDEGQQGAGSQAQPGEFMIVRWPEMSWSGSQNIPSVPSLRGCRRMGKMHMLAI
jgi:hypothetical protein